MSDGTELEALREELRQLRETTAELADRQAIRDCIMRQTRGVDRHDADLMTGAYHPDGVARFGPATVPAAEYGEWSNEVHGDRFGLHVHHLTTHNCELEGDVAHCETYVIGTFLSPDQQRASMVSGRYFDRLERRDGEWKIVVRRTVVDICIEGDASFLGAFRGTQVEEDDFWSHKDISYQRPLDVDTPVPAWH
jgi:hypothetical protein